MICNNDYFADILRVCEIKDLSCVMRFQSPFVYNYNEISSKYINVHCMSILLDSNVMR